MSDKKIYIVTNSFNGTFSECDCKTVSSVWDDKDIAMAVAATQYACSVDEFKINTELPGYAENAYKIIQKLKKRGKTVYQYEVEKALTK